VATFVNAEYRWHLPRFLSDGAVDTLKDIPGVQVWRKEPLIRCSYACANAIHAIVRRVCEGDGIAWATVEVSTSYTGLRVLKLPSLVPRGLWSTTPLSLRDNPTGITLTDYQRAGVTRLFAHGGGLVEAPAGSGKTLIADVAALADAHVAGLDTATILTVCKTGACEQQRREKVRFFGIEPFVWLPPSARRKGDRWQTPDDYNDAWRRGELPHGLRWIIVGWPAVRAWHAELAALGACAVVLDEAHYAKSADRVRYRLYVDEDAADDVRFDREDKDNRSASTAKLCASIPSRYLTTATPLANRLNDWWGLGNLIEQPGYGDFGFEAWSPTVSRFLMRYCNGARGDFGGIVTVKPHYSNVDEFKARISATRFVVGYRQLADQIPAVKRRVHKVTIAAQDKPIALSKADRAAYKSALDDAREEQRRAGVKLGDAGTTDNLDASKARLTMLRLADACNRKRTATVDLALEYVESAVTRPGDKPGAYDRSVPRGKVLLFFGLRRALEDVARKLRRKVAHVWIAQGDGCTELGAKADGSEDVAVTVDEVKDRYMACPGPAVIVGTYQFVGESHNLQDTDAIIVGMLPYTPHMVAQIIGRGARLGMGRPLDVVFVQAEGTADDRLVEVVIDKLPALEALGEGAHGLDGLSRDLRGIADLDTLLADYAASLLTEG
jgi:hypothetical protein